MASCGKGTRSKWACQAAATGVVLFMNGIERDLARLDPADNACFQGLSFDWIDAAIVVLMSRVLSRQFIQMAQRSLFADVRHAAHFDPAASVIRVDDE